MLEVDKKTFEDEVLKAEGYVFVDFFGDGCVPCQALMPFVHEMADKYGDKIKFTSLNTTKARRLAIGSLDFRLWLFTKMAKKLKK